MRINKSLCISFVVIAVLLTILWITCPICFQNNDDKTLMYLTAGFTTGTPEAGTVFGSFYYYGIICLLYRIYSGIAWYTIVELSMIAVSLWIICNSLIKSAETRGIILGTNTFIVMFLFCFMHFSTALQYTATAGLVAGAAISSLIVSLDDEKLFSSHFVVSLLMMVAAYGIRKQFGIVGLGAMLCVLFFEFFGKDKKQVIKKGIIVIAIFAIAFISNAIYEKATGIAEFNDYYAQAGTWIDYPHLQYEDDVNGVYESVGWDDTLYDAASNWFFMDENLTEDNFKTIVDAYDGAGLTLRDYYDRAHNLMLSSMIVNIQLVVWFVVLLLINVVAIIKKLPKRRLFSVDCLALMFAVVSVYFLIEGRFPMRAYQALVFIFMVPSIIMSVQMLGQAELRKTMVALVALILVIAAAGYKFKPDTNMVKYTYIVAHDKYRTIDIEKGKALEEYAMAHPNDMFIYDLDLALPADAFQTYSGEVPKNLVFWGGWVYNTPMYWHQIKENGFDDLYADEFLSGRVYFCGLEVSDILTAYMEKRYPGVRCNVVDQVGEMKIYQFSN